MKPSRTASPVPLLATVVLVLDDEAEEVARQLRHLCGMLDPLVQARLRFVRVMRGAGNQLLGASMAGTQGLFAVEAGVSAPTALLSRTPSRPVPTSSGRLGWQAPRPFDEALRETVAQVQHIGGAEALASHGFRLLPNDMAIYLVGRADTPWLAETAREAQRITRTINEQSDARRFALVVAAPEETANGRASLPGAHDWRARIEAQPWRDLLAWRNPATGHVGEPPLLYAFVYETWDDKSQFMRHSELHYAMAESLFALFATGLLEEPGFKDALDLSMAALDADPAVNRLGSIGTSLVAEPSHALTDYLAHRMAADVLVQRALIGGEGGAVVPSAQNGFDAEARQAAEEWRKRTLRPRLVTDRRPLPDRLPLRLSSQGGADTWHALALSAATPDGAPLTWRWQTAQSRLVFDDERFWNLSAQIDYETSLELDSWRDALAQSYTGLSADLRRELSSEISQHALAPEGVARGHAYIQAMRDALVDELRQNEDEGAEVIRQMKEHNLVLAERLRQHHPAGGIPQFPSVQPLLETPQMAHETESLMHDVVAATFKRTPVPATIGLVAVLLAIFGAVAAGVLRSPRLVAHLPASLQPLMVGSAALAWGALATLVIVALALIPAFWQIARLRRWQRAYAQERAVLWLGLARGFEHQQRISVLRDLIATVEQWRGEVEHWRASLGRIAHNLHDDAVAIASDDALNASLSRDLAVADNAVWDGIDLDDLYLKLRERIPEAQLGAEFLRYVQARTGDVAKVLDEGTIGPFAVEYMHRRLMATSDEATQLGQMDATAARSMVARAVAAARVPLRPRNDGRRLGAFDCIAASPDLPWLSRAADENKLAPVPIAARNWLLVTHVVSRSTHSLIH